MINKSTLTFIIVVKSETRKEGGVFVLYQYKISLFNHNLPLQVGCGGQGMILVGGRGGDRGEMFKTLCKILPL